MPRVVKEGCDRATSVRHSLQQVVVVVSVRSSSLLRCRARGCAPVTVVGKAPLQAFLIDIRELIANVVGVVSSRIDRLVPIQLFNLDQSSGYVFGVTFATALLIARGCLVTSSTTTTTAIGVLPRTAIGIGGHRGTAVPIVGISRPHETGCRIVARGDPVCGHLSGI